MNTSDHTSFANTTGFAAKYDRVPRGVAHFGLGEWDRALGNHRAVIRVIQAGDVAYAYLPWRRRDAFPQAKQVRIVDGQTGQTITSSVVVTCNREYGEVVFEPVSGPGLYYAYYLIPAGDCHRWDWPRWAFPIIQYAPPQSTAADAWRAKHQVGADDIGSLPNPGGSFVSPDPYPASWRDLPEAELVEFQSRGEWHSFYPMEIIATLEERLDLIQRCGTRPFLLFPEIRYHPIRMTRDIPYHWAVRSVDELDLFKDTVQRNEYLVFQVGVYAHRNLLANVKVTASALTGPGGARISSSSITCFNLVGINQRGQPFAKTIHVAPQEIQALWFGVDVPENARPGRYAGVVTITAQGMEPQTVRLRLRVRNKILADRGDGDPSRLSRLRWLNSSHAVDDSVCAPFTPVKVKGRTVRILGRTVELDESGMPARLTSFIDMFRIQDCGRDILAAPVRFEAIQDRKVLSWQTSRPARCRRQSSGKALFQAVQSAHGITKRSAVTIEMDGRIGVSITLESRQAQTLDGLRLILELPTDVCRYWLESPAAGEIQGSPQLAFACPKKMSKPIRQFQSAWVGDYNAGLAFSIAPTLVDRLKAENGHFRQTCTGITCRIVLDTGRLHLLVGDPIVFEFALSVTPFKPLPTEHWEWRYCHQAYGQDLKLEQGITAGATVFTQHHSSPNCPYISYLFPAAGTLKKAADRVHAKGGRFKAYNTIRELSTRASELWALRSLGHEILPACTANLGFESLAQLPLEYQLRDLVNEPFTGTLWMCEHLGDDYYARWHSQITAAGGRMIMEDSSVQISGASRWSNFYIEGLRWLMTHAGVDGLYLDGVTFDRESFLRVRKTLVRQKPQALIDAHSSPAQVMDFLGLIDSLWFGEGADYSREDAYWLTAVSGIPFGVPGELLLTEASVHRGMVYGLSQRYGWMPVDPSGLWKWWDDFEIKTADMIGYWMTRCPVKTSHPAIKATAYVHPGRRLAIAIASWATETITVRLEIDWSAVGLDLTQVRITVPEIAGFQPGLTPASLDALPVESGKGWIVLVEVTTQKGKA